MTRSETIVELATAMAKAQGAITAAAKGKENPHFRSKYADLASVWDACRKALTDNGLSVVQSPRLTFNGDSGFVEVETLLLHSSGQWMSDVITVPVSKLDAQGVGSAITYARRYALSAFASVAPDDDDGNSAVQGGPVKVPEPKGYDAWKTDMRATADEGSEALRKAWLASSAAIRGYANTHDQEWMDDLKGIAKAVKVSE